MAPTIDKRQAKKLVIVMGPTGAGKTALGLALAKKFGGDILTADSRQIYLGMDVGTAKPASPARRTEKEERRKGPDDAVLVEGVPHFLIDILTPDQQYSAAAFRDDALRIIADVHRRGRLPIVVGGTGFYIRALTGERPLPNIPPDPGFRAWADRQTVEALAAELRRLSPTIFAKVDNPKNRRRVTRYLEVARTPTATRRTEKEERSTGDGLRSPGPFSVLPSSFSKNRVLKLALVPPPDLLRQRLAARVDDMFRRGFVEEVRGLVRHFGEDAPGLQTTGYREILRGLREGWTAEQMRAAVFRAHRETARRQRTWLKREPGLIVVETPEAAVAPVREFLQKA